MRRTIIAIGVLVLTMTLSCGLASGFTFAVKAPASNPGPYNEGTLITYTSPGTFTTTFVLSGYPIDAMHIGNPLSNVLQKTANGYLVLSPMFFSIDSPSSAQEIMVSNKLATTPPDGGYGTASFGDLTGSLSTLPATRTNLGLNLPNVAYDVNALSLRNYNPGTDLFYFSIDDFVPGVSNTPSAMQTGDIFVRLPGTGSVIKVLDGVTDIGLYYDSKAPFIDAFHDDVDALIFVNTDNNSANNKFVTVTDPSTGQQVQLDLGDGILFSVDTNLPDPDGIGPRPPYVPSLDPVDVYFSALDGSAPIRVIDGQQAFLTSSGPFGLNQSDDLIALAAWGGESQQVPEPGTMLLVGTGLAGFVGLLRRRRMAD